MTSTSVTTDMSLEDNERFALMKFRRQVADCCTQPYHDDRYLLRWLRARKWDTAAAEKMLRESMHWRKLWEIDSLSDWNEPDVYKNYYPYGSTGFDKEGSPVIVVYFAGLDTYGILHASTKKDMVKATAKYLERYLSLARQQADKYGPTALKLTAIIDMVDFNLKQFTFRPAAEIMIQLIQMYEANYPEILKTCYIINVPRVFIFAFNVIKNFLNEYTLGKILLFKSEPEKWKAAILQSIEPDQLPVYLGGTLTDPDGNPKCFAKISAGGKVPKHMYTKKGESHQCDERYTSIVIKKSDKLCLPFTATEDGSFLRWSFNTEGHDIKFGITSKNGKNDIITQVPTRKVTSHQCEEIGFIPCSADTTYYVLFDNRYSILRNKKLNYIISITPPIPKDQTTPDKMIEE